MYYFGYKLYSLSITDVNNLGKHLDKSSETKLRLNNIILHILDRIASLYNIGGLPPATKEMEKIGTQANNIRGKFLDPTKNLNEAIPVKVLEKDDYKKYEIKPYTG